MKVEATVCDICGSVKAHTYTIPTYRTFDSQDGRCIFEPKLSVETLDLCDKCALEATSIHSIGICDQDYEIKPKKS